MLILNSLITFLATLRLSRLMVTDDLSAMALKEPLEDRIIAIEDQDKRDKLMRLKDGLECPFCVGFWLGAIVLILNRLLKPKTILGKLWRLFTASLALNYVTAHISSRLDSGE